MNAPHGERGLSALSAVPLIKEGNYGSEKMYGECPSKRRIN